MGEQFLLQKISCHTNATIRAISLLPSSPPLQSAISELQSVMYGPPPFVQDPSVQPSAGALRLQSYARYHIPSTPNLPAHPPKRTRTDSDDDGDNEFSLPIDSQTSGYLDWSEI